MLSVPFVLYFYELQTKLHWIIILWVKFPSLTFYNHNSGLGAIFSTFVKKNINVKMHDVLKLDV